MFILDEFGKRVWRHKYSKTLFVMRSYDWCDRVIVLDETDARHVVDDTQYSTFNFEDWIPVSKEEISVVKSNYKEIYD